MQETFGRVTAESLINGIPVLCSNRGGLPEAVGKGGYVFDIPAKYTLNTRIMPGAEEIETWLQTIEQLWDDESIYVQACLRARFGGRKWQADRLGDRYDQYFREAVNCAASCVDRSCSRAAASATETGLSWTKFVVSRRIPTGVAWRWVACLRQLVQKETWS